MKLLNKIFSKKSWANAFALFLILSVVFLPLSAHARRSKEQADPRVNDFIFSKFDGDYVLKRDDKGNSYLEVTENLTAIFQYENVNRGIERAIPRKFDGRIIFDNQVEAFRNGKPERIELNRREGDYSVFRIGNPDIYVAPGPQEYTLKYKLYNVFAKNSNKLILNTNGAQWKQPFVSVQAKLTVDDSAKSFLADGFDCYQGREGSTEKCLTSNKISDNQFVFNQFNLLAGQNLTFSVNFKDGAFPQPTLSTWDFIESMIVVLAVALVVGLLAVLIASIIWRIKKSRENRINKSVAPQYLPPKIEEIDILDAGNLMKSSKKLTAAILFLAVNGNLKIVENEKKGVFGRRVLTFEKLNEDNLNRDILSLLNKIFIGGSETADISKLSQGRALQIQSAVENAGFYSTKYYAKIAKEKPFKIFMGAFSGFMVLSFVAFFTGLMFEHIINASVFILFAIVCFTMSTLGQIVINSKQKSKLGFEMENYLKGLKMYIRLSEVERLKFNQSFENSERFKEEFGGSRVKLYEKLLPWAALFGLEKSWSKFLEKEFATENYSPVWIGAMNGFYIGNIASSINSISSTVNSYSSSISSSSGGGGGFSGGGAGGGGGGGW
ncbi:MAG: DUF2207 domain-containing protein [bacterium]|nr:DUF2207 domain-containing protein [bacterium]